MSKLFSPFKTAKLSLNNRIAMAPLTRSRAVNNLPNDLMVQYYSQRAEAGLIITEGTAPSINGSGYPNIPGIYTAEQVAGWKKITDAVHARGSKIFLQVMHTGRIAHELNLPEGGEIVAPSAIAAAIDTFTFQAGMQPHPVPRAMSLADIEQAQAEYVQAVHNAMEAGFDGVEIHAANGYLPDQFISPRTNQRTDLYGGSVENRCRFVLELTEKIVAAIGAERTGIRLSPYVQFNDMGDYPELPETYRYLVKKLDAMNLAYLHLLDVSALGVTGVPEGFLLNLAKDYRGAVMFNGGWVQRLAEAEALLDLSDNYFISIGAPFIANPDLVTRLRTGAPLEQADPNTFFSPGPEGYVTYPALAETAA